MRRSPTPSGTRWLVTAGTVVLAALLVSVFLTIRNVRALANDLAAVAHTHRVQSEIEHVLSLVKDAETGQRGFVITGEQRYLEIYTAALATIDDAVSSLYTLTADNPHLVEMHGGRVEAKSDGLGKGSEFLVRLPIALQDDAGGRVAAPVVQERRSRARRKVLVADDNVDAATSLALIIEMMGNEVRTAHDGLEAAELAESFQPDVVLLDIGMPSLSGYDVCRRIRAQAWSERTLLIALTGWGRDEDRRKSEEAGFHRHLVKPVDPAEIESLRHDPIPVPE